MASLASRKVGPPRAARSWSRDRPGATGAAAGGASRVLSRFRKDPHQTSSRGKPFCSGNGTGERTIPGKDQKRAHNPVLVAAGFDQADVAIRWLGGERLRLVFGSPHTGTSSGHGVKSQTSIV